MKSLQKFLQSQQSGLVLVIFAVIAILSLFAGWHVDAGGGYINNFMNPNTLMQTATDTSFFAIMAIGVTMVILTGGIDLSVGSIYALSGVAMAMTLRGLGVENGPVGLLIGLAICVVIGLGAGIINGLMVVKLKVHPFIITLGTMWIYRGLAFVVSKAESILVPNAVTSIIKSNFGLSGAIYPVPLLIVLVLMIVGEIFLLKTVSGRNIYAVGGNEQAARYAGIRVDKTLARVYAISGLMAGLAAFLGCVYYGSSSSNDAYGYELFVIASAVVGGASLLGGKGSAIGAVLGASLIVLIRQSIRTLHFDQNYEMIIIGLAIVVAVVLDQANQAYQKRQMAMAINEVEIKKGQRQAALTGLGLVALVLLMVGNQIAHKMNTVAKPDSLKIAMIAKSSSNPVFLSARAGAEAAAADLTAKTGVKITIDWRTPNDEDGQVQAMRLAQAVNDGANAALISCSDASKITGAINDAAARGVPVMTFDSDAPKSKRFAFYGTNDAECGAQTMRELAKQMDGKGTVAILGGNQNAPNLQARVNGAKEEAKKYPGITVAGAFYHPETPQDAAAEVVRVMNAYPDVNGWAMIGGWPLFTKTLLTDLDPAKVKVVSVDALPAELPYIIKGIAPVLLAQPTYLWGYTSVSKIVDKMVLNKPVPVINKMQLVRVDINNIGAWARQLKTWTFTDVPADMLKMTPDGKIDLPKE